MRKDKIWKAPNVKKETINIPQIADYSRLREFDVQYLLSYEIIKTSFYMKQDGRLQKSPKSELVRKLKNFLQESYPVTVPKFEERLKAMVVIDFMAYDWKMSTKKMDLIAYEDFFKVLWKSFSSLSIGSSGMDISSDLNLQESIK